MTNPSSPSVTQPDILDLLTDFFEACKQSGYNTPAVYKLLPELLLLCHRSTTDNPRLPDAYYVEAVDALIKQMR